MRLAPLLLVLPGLGLPAPAPAQAPAAHAGKRVTTSADIQAIEKVTVDFRTALTRKDAKLLSSLLVNDRILFTSPRSPASIRKQRQETNTHADGLQAAGAQDFLRFVATSKVPIEERFHDVRILQDGHVAWVIFDFDFLEDGRIENQGVEVWQMVKGADDTWKILSVVWSSNGPPR